MHRAVVALLALGLLAAAACTDDDSSKPSSSTSTTESASTSCKGCPVYGEDDAAIEVASGDDFVIELESNQTTGYQWTATSSDEAVVSEQSSEYVQPKTDRLGAPGKQRFVFSPATAGSVTLTLQYSRSFEDGADAREVTYSVTVT
jgi:inhibitor of cysteine peptidase